MEETKAQISVKMQEWVLMKNTKNLQHSKNDITYSETTIDVNSKTARTSQL